MAMKTRDGGKRHQGGRTHGIWQRMSPRGRRRSYGGDGDSRADAKRVGCVTQKMRFSRKAGEAGTGLQRPVWGFLSEICQTQRRAGHHLWTMMGEVQPPAAVTPPWARSRVAEVARESGVLCDNLRTAWGPVPFPLSHPTGAGDVGPELRLRLFPRRPSRPCARSLPWSRVWM